MNYRVFHNDILKSNALKLITMLLATAAAMLVSLAAVLVINLSGHCAALVESKQGPANQKTS